jgi:hypothetical protein
MVIGGKPAPAASASWRTQETAFPETVQVQPLPLAATLPKLPGMLSLTVIVPVVELEPELETVTVHVSVWPIAIGSTESVLLTLRVVQVMVTGVLVEFVVGPPPVTVAVTVVGPQLEAVPVALIAGTDPPSKEDVQVAVVPVVMHDQPEPLAVTPEKPGIAMVAVTSPPTEVEAGGVGVRV